MRSGFGRGGSGSQRGGVPPEVRIWKGRIRGPRGGVPPEVRIWKGRIRGPRGGVPPEGRIGCLGGKGGPERGAALFDTEISGLGWGGADWGYQIQG